MKKDEYYFQEGCFITELHNSPEDPTVSVARARVTPGSTTRWHSLTGVHERYLILAGEGRVEIGDEHPKKVHPGGVLLIPPGCRQRISNTGETDLIFLAVCTPRFIPAIYHDHEVAWISSCIQQSSRSRLSAWLRPILSRRMERIGCAAAYTLRRGNWLSVKAAEQNP